MAPECRHIKTSGGKCASPALRDQPYCYFHSRQRERASQQDSTFLREAFTSLEDRGAIQRAITEVGLALVEHRIDRKHASVLLYALQTAASNVKNAEPIVSSESIAELTRTKEGEELAPEGATAHPQQEESIADMLMRELRSHLEGGKEPSSDQAAQPAENKELTRKSRGEGGSPPADPKPDAQISADRITKDQEEDERELLTQWPLDEFGHPKPRWN